MRKYEPSVVKHQQQGVSLRAFSEQTGIREGQLRHYIRKGLIIGARQHPLTKKWWIYPPAKLVLSDGLACTRRSKASRPGFACEGEAPPRKPGAAFDVGTSPYGLAVDLCQAVQETPEAVVLPPLAKPLLTSDALRLSAQNPPSSDDPAQCQIFELEDSDELPDCDSPGELPDVFAEPRTQEVMRSIRKAAGEMHYPVVLSGSQMKHMIQALSEAIDGAIEALNCEPAEYHREIKPYLDAYNGIYRTLKAAKAAHKTVNENWRGMEL